MEKYLTKRNMIITASIIAAVIVVITIIKRRNRKFTIENDISLNTGSGILPSTQKPYSELWPLREGTGATNEGEKAMVRNVQKYLNKQGANIAVDGIFGRKTKEALLYYWGKPVVEREDYNRMVSIMTGMNI